VSVKTLFLAVMLPVSSDAALADKASHLLEQPKDTIGALASQSLCSETDDP